MPVEVLEAENIRPQELGRLPARWRLTGAWVHLRATPSGDYPLVNLVYLNPVYGDPEAGFGDYIWLGQTSDQCGLRSRAEVVGDPRPLAVRTFEGSVVESSSGTIGFLSDGTTVVQFETDLPVDDVAALLASLRPFEPDAEPEPLAAASMG